MRGVSKTTQTKIASLLKQWSKLRGRAARINAERDQKLKPIKVRFEQRCAPINLAADEKLQPLNLQLKELEGEITNVFLNEVKDGKGNFAFTRIAEACAVAEVISKPEREIDSKEFFDSIPPAKRDAAFWSCVKTLIGQAEKFLGKDRVKLLAHTKLKHTVTISEEK